MGIYLGPSDILWDIVPAGWPGQMDERGVAAGWPGQMKERWVAGSGGFAHGPDQGGRGA